MAAERSFHNRRKPRFGRTIFAAGTLLVLGAAGFGYGSRLAGFSGISALSSGFVVTNYPIRIALPVPLPAQGRPESATAAVGREVTGDAVTEGTAQPTAPLPMTLPVRPDDGGKTQSVADPSQDRAAIGDPGGVRLLKLNYSIAGEDRGSEAVVVKKKIIVDDVEKGTAELRISEGSQIFIRSSDLAGFGGKLGSTVASALRRSEYVNFDELRSLGLMIRYDAAHDRVLVSSEPA